MAGTITKIGLAIFAIVILMFGINVFFGSSFSALGTFGYAIVTGVLLLILLAVIIFKLNLKSNEPERKHIHEHVTDACNALAIANFSIPFASDGGDNVLERPESKVMMTVGDVAYFDYFDKMTNTTNQVYYDIKNRKIAGMVKGKLDDDPVKAIEIANKIAGNITKLSNIIDERHKNRIEQLKQGTVNESNGGINDGTIRTSKSTTTDPASSS